MRWRDSLSREREEQCLEDDDEPEEEEEVDCWSCAGFTSTGAAEETVEKEDVGEAGEDGYISEDGRRRVWSRM